MSQKVGDAGPILDVMDVMLESISSVTVMARNTMADVYRTAQIVASLPNVSDEKKGRAFLEALFHQLLLAMVSTDYETRVGAHRVFSVVLVPSSVCPRPSSTNTHSKKARDIQRTLSRTEGTGYSKMMVLGHGRVSVSGSERWMLQSALLRSKI